MPPPPPTIPNRHLWLKDEVKYQEIWVNCFDPCYFRNHRPILLADLWGVVDFPNALSSTQTNLLNVFFLSQMGISKNKKEKYVYVPLLLLKRNKLLGSQVSPRVRSYFTLD